MTLAAQARRAIALAGDLPTGLSPPGLRTMYAAQRARLQPPRPDVARVEELSIPGRDGPVAARLYVPRDDGAPRPLMADKNEVLAAINNGSICTINALRPEQHTGSGGVQYGRPGRIAGSFNVAATNLLDPATNAFLPADALRAKFEAVGAMDRSVARSAAKAAARSCTCGPKVQARTSSRGSSRSVGRPTM